MEGGWNWCKTNGQSQTLLTAPVAHWQVHQCNSILGKIWVAFVQLSMQIGILLNTNNKAKELWSAKDDCVMLASLQHNFFLCVHILYERAWLTNFITHRHLEKCQNAPFFVFIPQPSCVCVSWENHRVSLSSQGTWEVNCFESGACKTTFFIIMSDFEKSQRQCVIVCPPVSGRIRCWGWKRLQLIFWVCFLHVLTIFLCDERWRKLKEAHQSTAPHLAEMVVVHIYEKSAQKLAWAVFVPSISILFKWSVSNLKSIRLQRSHILRFFIHFCPEFWREKLSSEWLDMCVVINGQRAMPLWKVFFGINYSRNSFVLLTHIGLAWSLPPCGLGVKMMV